jgi:hypothetical protein
MIPSYILYVCVLDDEPTSSSEEGPVSPMLPFDEAWSPGDSISLIDDEVTPPSFKVYRITPPSAAAALMDEDDDDSSFDGFRYEMNQHHSYSSISGEQFSLHSYSASSLVISRPVFSPSDQDKFDKTLSPASPFSPGLLEWMAQTNLSGSPSYPASPRKNKENASIIVCGNGVVLDEKAAVSPEDTEKSEKPAADNMKS